MEKLSQERFPVREESERVNPQVTDSFRILYFKAVREELLLKAAKAQREGRPLDAWCLRLEAGNFIL